MIRRFEFPVRHDLVWLTTAGAEAATTALPPADQVLVKTWLAIDRPLIRTRLRPGDPSGWLSLGLPLPPSQGKRRLALCVPPEGVDRTSPPPRLAAVVDSAPSHWQGWLTRLEQEAVSAQIVLRVFGSLAWQYLTGETYLSEGSDIDLLWSSKDPIQLRTGLDLLQSWERESGLRADGEVLLPTGAVAWRELADSPTRVLVKDERTVTLQPLSVIRASLALQAAHR